MGRPKKADTEKKKEELELVPAEFIGKRPKPIGIDVSALVQSVKNKYSTKGKKETDKTKKNKGVAADAVIGSDISLSKNESDYVSSEAIRKYWIPLTGVLGTPFGRLIQISGKPDSGKSTLAMLFMAAAQDAGHLVILWDSEKKFSTARYEDHMGGDCAYLPVSRSKLITEGIKQISHFVKEAKLQNPDIKILIVWDSVGATLNTVDDDDEDDYSKQPGVTAKEVGWAVKKLNRLMERFRNVETGEETLGVVCINQTYANIGSVGQKEKGGSGIEYLSSIILQLTRKADLTRIRKGVKVKYGIVTRARVKKNHLFDGDDCVAELDLVVSAGGIELKEEIKGFGELSGWDGEEEE